MQLQTIIFTGPQGSGKGTHAEMLKAELSKWDPERNTIHFETGRQLREFAQDTNYTAGLVRETIARGELVPLFLSMRAFSEYMITNVQGNEHILIDGVPRTHDQLPIIDSAIKFFKRENPTVVHIEISDEEATKRLLLRKRDDDTEEGIKRRLRWTREQAAAIQEWFAGHPEYAYFKIDGEHTIEQVHQDVLAALKLP